MLMIIYWVGWKIKKNKEALVDASKQTGLEVNADTTKYMVMCRLTLKGWEGKKHCTVNREVSHTAQ